MVRLNCKLKLLAIAGGASGGHGRGSVAVDMGESIGRTSKRCTMGNGLAPGFPLSDHLSIGAGEKGAAIPSIL